ncbi:MAG TPA: hypothetical protein PLK12_09820, partial [Prolixibacteraceae bacterium]|nr:hypothetical protein [Prolixibacteraceae bacterium]
MPIRFNPLRTLLILLWLILAMVPFRVGAQTAPVTVSVGIMPPYSSSLSDYITIPNKLLITLTHTQPTQGPLEVYLGFSIRGDAGLSVASEPGYKPGTSLYLQPGSLKMLTLDELGSMFNMNHLVSEGVVLTELFSGAGLPEDHYQICIQVFDYFTDQSLSEPDPMGCSNVFFISNLEPPLITQPVCGELLPPQSFQNVLINWTIPAGALLPEYRFELIEIPPGIDLNPNEAFDVSGFTPVYEETLYANMILLTSDRVSLLPGYTYAFRIQATDPTGSNHFRNNGYSEVCTFLYPEGSGSSLPETIETIRIMIPSACHPDSQLVVTNLRDFFINWRIDRIQTNPDAVNPNIDFLSLEEQYPGAKFYLRFFDAKNLKNEIHSAATTQFHWQIGSAQANTLFQNNTPYWFTVELCDSLTGENLIPSQKCSFLYHFYEETAEYEQKTLSGKISYRFENNPEAGTFPVRNAKIRLLCLTHLIQEADTILLSSEELGLAPSPTKNLKIKQTSLIPDHAPGPITNDEGEFALSFRWLKNAGLGMVSQNYQTSIDGTIQRGILTREICIRLENPYYADPQLALNAWTGDPMIDIGEITTFVKSYHLNAFIEEGYPSAGNLKNPLTGKKIYILRKDPSSALPGYEGDLTPPGALVQAVPILVQNGYRVVSVGTTSAQKDEEGNDRALASFPNLIQNRVQGDHYYLWMEGNPIESVESFQYKKPESHYSFTSSMQTGL